MMVQIIGAINHYIPMLGGTVPTKILVILGFLETLFLLDDQSMQKTRHVVGMEQILLLVLLFPILYLQDRIYGMRIHHIVFVVVLLDDLLL